MYSELGRGTTFKIYLPHVEDIAGVVPLQVPDGEFLRGSETILVIEDEDVVRKLISAILQRNGYRALAAEDGEQALRLSAEQEGPTHVLLADVVMPRMNGRELAERFRSSRRDLWVLYMSRYTGNAMVHNELSETSGDRILEKPFLHDDLLRPVRVTLSSRPRE